MGDGAIKVMGSGAPPQKNLASNVLKTRGVFCIEKCHTNGGLLKYVNTVPPCASCILGSGAEPQKLDRDLEIVLKQAR